MPPSARYNVSFRASRGRKRPKACQRLSPDEKDRGGGNGAAASVCRHGGSGRRTAARNAPCSIPTRHRAEIERSERPPPLRHAHAPTVPRPDGTASRALPDQGPVEGPRPEAVLGIERPADDEHRRLDVVTGTAQVARLPPRVVGGCADISSQKGLGLSSPVSSASAVCSRKNVRSSGGSAGTWGHLSRPEYGPEGYSYRSGSGRSR